MLHDNALYKFNIDIDIFDVAEINKSVDYLFSTNVLWHLKCAQFIFDWGSSPNPACKANDVPQTHSNLPIPGWWVGKPASQTR